MPKSIYRPEYEVLRCMIRDMRLRAGVTQAELSRAMGRSQSFISDVERGARRLDVLELRDMCRSLGRSFPGLASAWERRISSLD